MAVHDLEPLSVQPGSLSPDQVRAQRFLGKFTARERHQARRLTAVFVLVALFFGVELFGATMAKSDVLRADALHLLTDVAALAMALWAMRLSVRRPTDRFTFGWRRAEPVAAIFNAGLVLTATALLVAQAIGGLGGRGSPRADIMLYVAMGALVVNGLSAWLIHDAIGAAHAIGDLRLATAPHERGEHHGIVHGDHDHEHGQRRHEAHHEEAHHEEAHHEEAPGHQQGHTKGEERGHGDPHGHHGHSLNLRGAWLHLLGDALGSLAALIAAILIRLGFSPKVDPAASFVVAGILVVGALRLLRDAGMILLEAAPRHLPVARVRSTILGVPGVADIHELHVWTLGAGHDALSTHVLAERADPALGRRVEQAIRQRFPVEYVTVQVETEAAGCQADPSKSRLGT